MINKENKSYFICALALSALFAILFVSAPTLRADNSEWTPNYEWYSGVAAPAGTEADPYIITDAESLAGLSALVNYASDDFKGKYILLALDIDLAGKEWQPIGWFASGMTGNLRYFEGSFNGGGHKITGMKISSGSNFIKSASGMQSGTAGLFGLLGNSGTVKNLYLEGSVSNKTSNGTGATALLVGEGCGVIKNCMVSGDVTSTADRNYVGGIVGLQYTANNVVTNCIAYGSVDSKNSPAYSGGIAGFSSWYNGSVNNCTAMCSSIVSTMDAGGIYGGFNARTTQDSVSVSELVSGSSASTTGGIVGAFGFGYQNCYWLKVTASQPAGAVGGSGTTGMISDAALLPVASVIMDPADLATLKPGETRTIHLRTYPPTASNSHLTYNWSVDENKLAIVGGQGSSALTVKALDISKTEYASVSVDVYGLLGHTTSDDKKTYISDFETTLTPECVMKLVAGTIHVEAVTVSGSSTAMEEGETRTFSAAIKPSDADDKSVSWAITGVSGEADKSDLVLTDNKDGTVKVFLRNGRHGAGYVLTATAADGGITGNIAINSSVSVKGEDISGIIPVGAAVPDGAEALKPVGANSSELVSLATAIGTSVENFRTNATGVVFLADSTAETAAANVVEAAGRELVQVIHFPLFKLTLAKANGLATTAFIISGDKLLADKPENINVAMLNPAGTGKFYEYAAASADYTNGHFTLQKMDDSLVASGEAIDSALTYKLVLYVQDNGSFDLNPAEGSIVSPFAVVRMKDKEAAASSSGSGGCSTGVGIFALLALIPVSVKCRKRK